MEFLMWDLLLKMEYVRFFVDDPFIINSIIFRYFYYWASFYSLEGVVITTNGPFCNVLDPDPRPVFYSGPSSQPVINSIDPDPFKERH